MLFFSALRSIPGTPPFRPFLILALLVPFACYLWGLSDAHILPQTARRPLRLAVHVLIAAALALGGFIMGLHLVAAHAAGY